MNLSFSAPSKTFLAGEYAVLKGAPALVLCTTPRFTFRAARGEAGVMGIPLGSPAARWLEQRSPLIADWKLEFHDPHGGKGGFGASSAQFLFVHALTTLLQISVSRAVEGIDLKALLQDFKVLSGGRASGADVLAQATGGVAVVHGDSAEHFAWPFPDLDFAILRTGFKVATHVHLAELDGSRLNELVAPANEVQQCFTSGSVEKFLLSLKKYARLLRDLELQAPATLKLLASLEEQSWCKVAKGCGALGADTVLVLFAREDRMSAYQYILDAGLERVDAEIGEGLTMNWTWT